MNKGQRIALHERLDRIEAKLDKLLARKKPGPKPKKKRKPAAKPKVKALASPGDGRLPKPGEPLPGSMVITNNAPLIKID